MKFKKIAALVLSAAMLASMPISANAAIIGANEDAPNTTVSDETIVVTMASEPAELWGAPTGGNANETQLISAAIMDTLTKTDQVTGEVLPNLATEWEWVDGTHCKYTLRDDVMMGDAPLTADDVAYTVGIWVEKSANNDTGRFVVGAEVVDEHTVIIEYNVEAPDLVGMMSWSNFGIVSEAQVEAAGGIDAVNTNPLVGCGKYKFVEWNNGTNVILERNEDYWNKDAMPYFKTIDVRFTNDAAARAMAVQAGDSQVAIDMPVMTAVNYQADESVNVPVYDFGQVLHLFFNMAEDRPTADENLREAIMLALDYDALAAVGTGQQATKALGYWSPSSQYYVEDYTAEEKARDIETAKQMIADGGYEGLELSILGTQDSVPYYTAIQAMLGEVGITVNVNCPDTPAFFVAAAFDKDYDLIGVGEWLPNRNPSIYCFFDQDNPVVVGGPNTKRQDWDDAVAAIIAEADKDTAISMMADFQASLKEEHICTDLYPELKAAIVASDIKGFSTIERGFVDITGFYK